MSSITWPSWAARSGPQSSLALRHNDAAISSTVSPAASGASRGSTMLSVHLRARSVRTALVTGTTEVTAGGFRLSRPASRRDRNERYPVSWMCDYLELLA